MFIASAPIVSSFLIDESKALRQTEISELFVFASFGNVRFSKFGNFLEKTGIFKLAEFSRKSSEKSLEKVWKFKFGKKFGNYSKIS